ncbi:MAG: hypothetical protein ACREH4_10335 [Vitreimonas sp.]
MAVTQKQEARALSADERELVAKSHHPAVQALSDKELADLVKRVRERRSRAQTEAARRRREMRGKSEPKGAAPSKADEGSKLKAGVLATAARRLNSETERRRRMRSRVDMMSNARKALAMKQAADIDRPEFNTRTAHQGVRNIPSTRADSLIRPMERGRLRKQNAAAQASRDAR